MPETPKDFAKRRVAELQPLIDQCLPGTRLRIEYFPVSYAEREQMLASLDAKAPAELTERIGDEKAKRLEETFQQITELKMAEKIDTERMNKAYALGLELLQRGYKIAWEDQDPRDEIEMSELDLTALNFERAAVPKEGTFLTIMFDAEA